MKRGIILWIDDEIDLLKSHIHFLNSKGYHVIPATNGDDGIQVVRRKKVDIVLLDEMMAGKDGISTLGEIKSVSPGLPVIMITKNEEESLMDQAIGGKITDYLTKPVNPSQILSACKKALDRTRISEEHVSSSYMGEIQGISNILMQDLGTEEWMDIHQKLSGWDVEFDEISDTTLRHTLQDQRKECNIAFGKFIDRNYRKWMDQQYPERPLLSPDIVQHYVGPHIRDGKKVLFLVVDGMRLDQWLTIEPMIYDFFHLKRNYYYSIIPSATPYARNALFAGKFPLEIEKTYPDLYHTQDDDEQSLNRYEDELIRTQVADMDIHLNTPPRYIKVLDSDFGWSITKKLPTMLNLQLISIVLNFVDILAHRRSDTDILKEIVPDEAGYRSVLRSWFKHSWLYEALKLFSQKDFILVLTSDHGSIRVLKDVKVVADRETSTNIRYKHGRNLNISPKYALLVKEPEQYNLPARGVNTNYIISKEDYYFVYPTNYHQYVKQYYDTFQHGGISLEEMIVPVITMEGKNR